MTEFFLRIGALLVHALLNFIVITYLLEFDITGSWLSLVGFILAILLLTILVIRHILSFVHYIKTKTK